MAIAKMNRLFIVGVSAYKEETLRFLQKLGVVHLEPVVEPAGDKEKEASAALSHLKRLTQIERAVSAYAGRKTFAPVECADDELFPVAEEDLNAMQNLKSSREILERLVADLAPWGDFDPGLLQRLETDGIYVQRWRMEHKKGVELQMPGDVYQEIVSEKPRLLFYTISPHGPVDVAGAMPLPVPEMRLSEAKREIEQMKSGEDYLADRLAGMARKTDIMKQQIAIALNNASFLEKDGTMFASQHIFGLQGWLPAEDAEDFLRKVDERRLPLKVEIRAPLVDEEPPILLKNNWFVRRIEPLLKLYGIPPYRTLDPSYFFAPFMVLFFGICLSDAGYGLVFYLVAHFLGRKLGDKVEGMTLVVKLSKAFAVCAMIVGLLTGSVFGYNFEDRTWILFDVSVDAGDPMLLFYLALGLGVVHLSISYILGMIQTRRRYLKFCKLGLLFVLWGGVALVVRNIWFDAPQTALNRCLLYAGTGVFSAGVLLTLFFSSEHWQWYVRFGVGLWNVYGLTGLIGDLLSYARLFGLGIGTASIAAVMNQLARMVFDAAGPIVGLPLAIIVVIFGHTFNLALSLLGSTVHSARLHFVEAFKSFFEGGGTEYKPFKIERG